MREIVLTISRDQFEKLENETIAEIRFTDSKLMESGKLNMVIPTQLGFNLKLVESA